MIVRSRLRCVLNWPLLIITVLLQLAAWSAAADEVLMGYTSLDSHGQPQGVQVALPKERFTRLWAAAHPGATSATPPAALATGPAATLLSWHDGRLDAWVTVPVAVLAAEWQVLRWTVVPGSVQAVTLLDFAGVPAPTAVTWTVRGTILELTVPPRCQGLLRVTLAVAGSGTDDERTLLPLVTGFGGPVEAWGSDGRLPEADGLTFTVQERGSRGRCAVTDLPTGLTQTELMWRRAATTVVTAGRMTAALALTVTHLDDRLGWLAIMRLAPQPGQVLDRLDIELPTGLVPTAVTGAGVGAWTVEGSRLTVRWREASTAPALSITGILPLPAGATTAAVVPRLPDAAFSGRLGLVVPTRLQSAWRFQRPEAADLTRVEPLADEALAVGWNRGSGPLVTWERPDTALRLSVRGGLLVRAQGQRATVLLDLAGRGTLDALRLRLPTAWRVTAASDAAGAPLSALRAPGEVLVLRGATPLGAGTIIAHLEAERPADLTTVTPPALVPVDASVVRERATWLAGDGGSDRLGLPAGVLPVDGAALAAALARSGLEPAAGERWRWAWEEQRDQAVVLRVGTAVVQRDVDASHYLVLHHDRLRWSAHLTWRTIQGSSDTMRLRLPAGATLVQLTGADLASWSVSAGVLTARLAASTARTQPLDLALEVALSATGSRLEGTIGALVPLDDQTGRQQVVLVEDDDLGRTGRTVSGLQDDATMAMPLPAGVDAAAVTTRYRAVRPDWSLSAWREPLTAGAGADRIATLVDLDSRLGGDGELRTRGTWHLVERHRRQLALRLPPGCELWEVRVAGTAVHPRSDATDAALRWIPITPLRPGEAALRIELVWREQLDASQPFSPSAPAFDELAVLRCLWRLSPPSGATLLRVSGSLEVTTGTAADDARARRVMQELAALRAQGGLAANALVRQNQQLALLDIELADYLKAPPPAQGPAAGDYANMQLEAVTSYGELQSQMLNNDKELGLRYKRRSALNLDQRQQDWSPAVPLSAPTTSRTQQDRQVPTAPAVSWAQAMVLAPTACLPAGLAPAGQRGVDGIGLLGVDLLGPESPGGLRLAGTGGDLRVTLRLQQPGAPLWPWGLLAAGAILSLGMVRRRTHAI